MSMARVWRVGVIGLGHWYSAYALARELREYPKARLVAVAWDDKLQREEFANSFSIEAHSSHEELLARRPAAASRLTCSTKQWNRCVDVGHL